MPEILLAKAIFECPVTVHRDWGEGDDLGQVLTMKGHTSYTVRCKNSIVYTELCRRHVSMGLDQYIDKRMKSSTHRKDDSPAFTFKIWGSFC